MVKRRWKVRYDRFGVSVVEDRGGCWEAVLRGVASHTGYDIGVVRDVVRTLWGVMGLGLGRGWRLGVGNFGVFVPYYRVFKKLGGRWMVRFRCSDDFGVLLGARLEERLKDDKRLGSLRGGVYGHSRKQARDIELRDVL